VGSNPTLSATHLPWGWAAVWLEEGTGAPDPARAVTADAPLMPLGVRTLGVGTLEVESQGVETQAVETQAVETQETGTLRVGDLRPVHPLAGPVISRWTSGSE
jgi:hypothetical protein